MLWLYDNNENLIDSLEPITCVLQQKITGEDFLEIETLQDVQKDMRIIRREQNDYFEYIVESVEQVKSGSVAQINHITAVTSIVELRMDVVHDVRPQDVSAATAVVRVLGDNPRWSIGKVDELGNASANFYRVSQFEALKTIANTWHGELYSTIELRDNRIYKRYINLSKQRGSWKGKRFTYSKDIQGVKRFVGERPIYTKVYAYGKGEDGGGRRRTIASVNGGKEYVEDEAATAQFGRLDGNGNKVPNTYFAIDEEIEDLNELLEFAKSELKRLSKPEITFDIDVIDLSQISGFEHEGVCIGDTVAVIDESFNPKIRLKARVIELEIDLLDRKNSRIKIGNFIPSILDTMTGYDDAFNKVNERSEIWNRAKIIGANGQIQASFIEGLLRHLGNEFEVGGHYIDFNQLEGLIITDKPKGYNPTWAMNIGSKGFRIADGKLSNGNWNWRTYGTGKGFTADVINAGSIRGQNGFWDLDSGDIQLNNLRGSNADLSGSLTSGSTNKINIRDGKIEGSQNGKYLGKIDFDSWAYSHDGYDFDDGLQITAPAIFLNTNKLYYAGAGSGSRSNRMLDGYVLIADGVKTRVVQDGDGVWYTAVAIHYSNLIVYGGLVKSVESKGWEGDRRAL